LHNFIPNNYFGCDFNYIHPLFSGEADVMKP